ncbi:lantibiotic dehydratase [Streptomyces nigrescens]|uniref:Lantibiotic dehydratase family protein n=1 Tax=Streptomyces nigrescens TaxID=1920 RepID=A0ABY7JCF8_STRNI|nr:lantibiotic dehydratase [Streptomyces nigrescens]WAU09017.1 lantibiotic dehydratase family protein [Streptomyces nigrescens]
MTSYSVRESFFVRFCGLPVSVLDELTQRRSWGLVKEIQALDEALDVDAEILKDALYSVIGGLVDSASKPRLVALRRCVHRRRFPAKGEWGPSVARTLPGEVATQVEKWLKRMRKRESVLGELFATAEQETHEETRSLLKAATDPVFRHALSQASPALLDELLRLELAGQSKLRRRTAIGLTKFVSRAATKTSPYSTFTATAAGAWTGTGPLFSSSGNDELRCVLELDRMVLEQTAHSLLADGKPSDALRIRPNPSLIELDGRFTFLGRRPAESLVAIPASREVRECLRIVGDGCTVGYLHSTLAARTPQQSAAVRFCEQLVRMGVLEYESPVPDQSERPLDDLLQYLGTTASDRRRKVIPLLESLRDGLQQDPSPAAVAPYREQQRAISSLVADIGQELGLDWPKADVLRKVAFHENAVRVGGDISCSAPQWRPVLDDLDVLRRWLALHDRMLPVRVALTAYAGHRFGTGASVPFLALHAAVQADLARDEADCPDWLRPLRPFLQLSNPVPADELERSPVPPLSRLHRLRRESLGTVLSADRQEDGVLRTDPAVLTELSSQWPDWVRTPGSIACYLQPYTVDGELKAVVNTISGGWGKGRARWSRLLDQAGGHINDAPRPDDGHSPLLAEMSGTFGVSVNLRKAAAPYEIDYPYTTSTRPENERIPLNDLLVRHIPLGATLELWSRSKGRRVQPAHLGMMADPLLPPAARLLFAAFGQSYLLHPSLSLFKPREVDEPSDVAFQPRIEVGRAVVQRAEWSAPSACVPRERTGEPDGAYLLRLAEWLRAHQIPRRCFVRLYATDGDWVSRVFVKSRKPMFLDFASLSMVAVFRNMTKEFSGRVGFEEALPDPSDPSPFECGGPRVAEFVVELTADGC